jgi:uncharacterized repeat protein (TIGR04138 family)
MREFKDFFLRLERIIGQDDRYEKDTYLFVMTALSRAMRKLKSPRHLTGQELLKGIQTEARDQFGPMAALVLEHWGIKNTLDFGHVVFNMVAEGILSKTESDSLEDFKDEQFFENLFDETKGYRFWEASPPRRRSVSISKI